MRSTKTFQDLFTENSIILSAILMRVKIIESIEVRRLEVPIKCVFSLEYGFMLSKCGHIASTVRQ